MLNDVINGYEDGLFKPDNNITVAEFLKMLVQYIDYKKVLEGERWPDWYVNTAKYYGFIYENEFDDYDKPISRKEVATILGRYINLTDVKKSKNVFSDEVSSDVLKLYTLGVISGYEDGTYRGNNEITRAEASVIVCRAVSVRRSLVANKKYDIKNSEKLTNIGKTPSYKSDFSNRYEIKNNKIYFYDAGRYATLDGYTINEKYITNEKLIKMIKVLIQEDGYVALSYMPDQNLLNKMTLNFGKREGYVYNHNIAFGYTFYEDKPYELRRISMNDSLSEECFIKITIDRMWKDFADVKNGEYAHETNNYKLLKSLEVLFEKNFAKEIFDYIQEYLPAVKQNGAEKQYAEMKKIGDYEVNIYNRGTQFNIYISK